MYAVFLAAGLNCCECNCFLIGTNNRCWLLFKTKPPSSSNVRRSWDQARCPQLYPATTTPGKLFVPGDSAGSETRISFSEQKRKYLSFVETGKQQLGGWSPKSLLCPAEVCECLNRWETQIKGNKRITKEMWNVFHEEAKATCPFLPKGNNGRNVLSPGPKQHSGKSPTVSVFHSIKKLFRMCSLLRQQWISLTWYDKKPMLNHSILKGPVKHNLSSHSSDLANFKGA